MVWPINSFAAAWFGLFVGLALVWPTSRIGASWCDGRCDGLCDGVILARPNGVRYLDVLTSSTVILLHC